MPPSRARRAAAGRGSDLGNGFSVPGDDHFFTGLHGPDDLRQPVLGFGDADVHVLIIAIFYGYSGPYPKCGWKLSLGFTARSRAF